MMNPGASFQEQQYDVPASKRPRVESSLMQSQEQKQANPDPFDDCFTGDELLELEVVASQVENSKANNAKRCNSVKPFNQGNSSGAIYFKATRSCEPHRATNFDAGNLSLVKETKDAIHEVMLLEKQCLDYKNKVEDLESLLEQKSGEARLLRDRVNHAERVLYEERKTMMMTEQKRKDDKLERESSLEKKVEAYKDQVSFKEAELLEAEHLIKNLEMKNKQLTESRISASQHPFTTDHPFPALNMVKVVKPESPVVKTKLLTEYNENITPIITKTPTTVKEKRNLNKERRIFSLCPNALEDNDMLIPTPNRRPLYDVIAYFSDVSNSDAAMLDGVEAAVRLLGMRSNADNEMSIAHASTVVRMIMTKLETAGHQPHAAMTSQFEAMTLLFDSVDGLRCKFRNAPFVSVLSHHIEEIPAESYRLLAESARASTSDEVAVYLPIISELRFSDDLRTNSEILRFLCQLSCSSDTIEKIIKRKEDSVVTQLRRVIEESDTTSEWWNCFVRQALHFLTALICHHDVMLTSSGCFSEVYCCINSALYRLLDSGGESVEQWVVSLHGCSNLCKPENMPGVVRNHRHLLMIWMLKAFMCGKAANIWNDEIKRILKIETETLEKL